MSSISILLWNARGCSNKKEELGYSLFHHKIDIGIITEIKQSISDIDANNSNITISGFNTIAVNNHTGGRIRAGGAAVLARKDITIQKMEIPKAYVKNLDCVTVVVQRNNEKFVLIGIYRRPGSRLQRGVMKKLTSKVKEICKLKYGRELSVVLAGDFNAHNRIWNWIRITRVSLY